MNDKQTDLNRYGDLLWRSLRQNEPDAPTVYFIHGRAGNISSMQPFARLIPESFNLFAVEAPKEDELGGYSWWRMEEKELFPALHLETTNTLLKSINTLEQSLKLNPKLRLACGFSQGGMILSLALQIAPERFDGIALLSSQVLKLPKPPERSSEAFPEVIIAHGTKDEIIPVEKATRSEAFLSELGCEVYTVLDEVGHKVGREGMKALREWFASYSV